MTHISETFKTLKSQGRKALMPFYTMGYPTLDSAFDIIPAIEQAGANLVELGVPFSDPLADGPTIQASSQVALDNGMTLALCLEQAKELRTRGVRIPFVLMGYYNPILQYGVERFVSDAQASGINGLIVPDLPPEEADTLLAALKGSEVDLIFLVAPTSSQGRLERVAALSTGFIYLVSLVGVTGARNTVSSTLAEFVTRVRAVTDKPLAVGFGISTPEQAAQVAELADGVIVGSAFIKALGGKEEASAFVGRLREGIDTTR